MYVLLWLVVEIKKLNILNIIDDSLKCIRNFLTIVLIILHTRSGGLEPLTNPKIGELVNYAKSKNIKLPIITNGYSLTESF